MPILLVPHDVDRRVCCVCVCVLVCIADKHLACCIVWVVRVAVIQHDDDKVEDEVLQNFRRVIYVSQALRPPCSLKSSRQKPAEATNLDRPCRVWQWTGLPLRPTLAGRLVCKHPRVLYVAPHLGRHPKLNGTTGPSDFSSPSPPSTHAESSASKVAAFRRTRSSACRAACHVPETAWKLLDT